MLLLGTLLRKAARPEMFGAKPALIFGEEQLTYRQLNERVNRLANALVAQGVCRGDRVAVLGRNSPEYVVIYFALAKIGAIMVPVNFWYKADEIRYTVDQSESSLLIYEEDFRPAIEPIAESLASVKACLRYASPGSPAGEIEELIELGAPTEPDVPLHEDDPHIILYTSGTTGFPKGAVLSHRNHYLNAAAWVLMTGLRSTDVGLNVYPLFHTGGPDCVLLPHFLMGASVVILRNPDPTEILKATVRWRVTNIFCVPTVWRRILNVEGFDRYDVRSVRQCLGSSDTFPEELLDGIHRRFDAEVYVTYGLTEAGPILTFCRMARQDQRKIHAVGVPHPLVEVRIVDPDGRDVKVGEVGEIVARGPTVMQGYWRMPERAAEAIRDGWLLSGDLGRYDEDGYISIAGRLKDMIISGGENIYPVEIERLLRQHPGIKDVAVIGVPDLEWGESVLAVVVPAEGAALTADEAIAFVRDRLAGYKKPRYVEFVDKLPVTAATGKVQKAVLRQIYGPQCGRT